MYGTIAINNDGSINIVVSNFNGTDNTNSSILSVYGIKNK